MTNFTKAQIRDFAKRHGITFIDLRRNYAFHLIFGTQGNEDLLLMLVNAILPDQGITSVKLNPTENAGLREDSRSSVFDISATTSTGTFINIEMQFSDQDDFGDRMVFYLCFPIINDLRTGKLESFKLATKYSIGITNFVLKGIDKNDDVINYYGIRNEVEGRSPLSKNVHYVTVELPKFTKSLQSGIVKHLGHAFDAVLAKIDFRHNDIEILSFVPVNKVNKKFGIFVFDERETVSDSVAAGRVRPGGSAAQAGAGQGLRAQDLRG